MRKYLALTRLSFQEGLFYRINFLFYFLRQLLWFLTEILLWQVVFRSQNSIAGYNYNQIFGYFLIVYLIRIISTTGVDAYLATLIRTGELSKYLLRPLSLFWAVFFHQLGRKISRLIYLVVFGLILTFLGWLKIDLFRLLFFSLIFINAILLSFIYRFLLGNLAFWLINISSILWFFRQSANFLAGGWLPISFFPDWLEQLIRVLPFYLALGFPAEFFQGRLSLSLALMRVSQQLFWIIVLFFLTAILWHRGIKKYEAVGN